MRFHQWIVLHQINQMTSLLIKKSPEDKKVHNKVQNVKKIKKEKAIRELIWRELKY